MNDKTLYKNIGFNVILKPVAMILSFIYVPLALNYLGEEKYGVWATILSFVSWFSLCDIGIGNGMRNKLAEYHTLGDKQKSREIVSTAYFALTIISTAMLLIYGLINFNVDISSLFNIALPNENVNLSVLITVALVCLNFVLSLANTITYALQKPAIASLCSVLGQLLNIIFIVVAQKLMPANLVIVAILLGGSTAIVNLLLNLFCFRKFQYLTPSIMMIRRNQLQSIGTLGIVFFIGQISTMVMNATDNLVISKLFGPAEVTPYTTSYKLYMVFIQLLGAVIMPMWSAFTSSCVRGDYVWIKKKMKQMNSLALLASFGVVFVTIFMRPITHIWLQKDLNFDDRTTIIMAVYFICYLFSNNYASLLCGLGAVKGYSIMALLSGVLNIPLSILFATKLSMGISGVILGTMVTMVPTLVVYMLITRKLYKQWGV